MTVIIGIDPHKRSHTAVALDEHDQQLDELRVIADRRQVDRLQAWAARWPDRVWAIENANGLGWLLARQLVAAGEQVRDVPPKLSAGVRKLAGSGHKTDAHDAHSTAIAGRHAKVLRTVEIDHGVELLALLVERRWHIVDTRQKTLVRIHEQLTKLQPGGYSKKLSADKVARLLRSIRPTDALAARRRQVVKELLVDLRRLDKQRKQINVELDQALADYGTCLTDIDGIGRVAAATIIAIVGDVRRFPTEAHFGSFSGTAPVAASSGEKVRYRLNLDGQRQINKVLHTAAKTQIRMAGSPGRAYVIRKMDEGKTRREATRSLKRHLANTVYRALQADVANKQVSGEDRQAA
jgi:transposase